MKKTFFFFIVVIVCYVFARLFIAHKGYVLLSWGPYVLESSLWSFLGALMICGVAIALVISFIQLFFGGISLFYPVTRKAKSKKALMQATRGMIYFSNGRWHAAYKLLISAANAGQAPLMTYLVAARAAHNEGNYEASAQCLRKADKAAVGAELVVGVTRAELLLECGQKEQALAILKRLYKKASNHTQVLKLLKQSYYELKDWVALSKLLPELRKRKVINASEHTMIHHQTYNALFEQAYQTGKGESEINVRLQPIQAIWNSFNNEHKKDEYLICQYTAAMVRLGAEEAAEIFIRKQLMHKYSPKLMKLYGNLSQCDKQKQLATAEELLSQHQNEPILLLSLGKICIRCDLKGKALSYLKRCLAISPSVTAYNMVGQLLVEQKNYEKSAEYFQKGACLSAQKKEEFKSRRLYGNDL